MIGLSDLRSTGGWMLAASTLGAVAGKKLA